MKEVYKLSITIFTDRISITTKTGLDIVNITSRLTDSLKKSKIINGSLNATVIGSTSSVTTIEFEPGVVNDLKKAITRFAPQDIEYEHEKAWHDGNGHSHVQAALLGPSIVLPVRDGCLTLGTWQQAVIINHDNRARERVVDITIIGTA
ncbi:MAG: YjbQ family protein [Deltaproteobacteria bacterium]|nr:YjbQ family protein [Deltaproteobacteria bacterium]